MPSVRWSGAGCGVGDMLFKPHDCPSEPGIVAVDVIANEGDADVESIRAGSVDAKYMCSL